MMLVRYLNLKKWVCQKFHDFFPKIMNYHSKSILLEFVILFQISKDTSVLGALFQLNDT